MQQNYSLCIDTCITKGYLQCNEMNYIQDQQTQGKAELCELDSVYIIIQSNITHFGVGKQNGQKSYLK